MGRRLGRTVSLFGWHLTLDRADADEHECVVVYEHPSVKQLADYLLALQSGQSGEKSDEQQREVMLAMLEKYSARFVTRNTATAIPQDGSHVVVSTVKISFLHLLDPFN